MSLADIMEKLAARGVHKTPLAVVSDDEADVLKPAGEAARVIKPSELLQPGEAQNCPNAQRLSPNASLPEAKTERRRDAATERQADAGPANGSPGQLFLPSVPLSSATRLEELELAIRQSKVAWVVAARSLVEIRDQQLYKPYAETMDAYLETRGKERFGVKKRRCHDLMRAAVVAKNCRHVTHELCLAAALVLADLPKDKQAFGLSEAIKLAKNRNPSASQVAEAIAPFVIDKPGSPKRKRGKKAKPIKYRSAAGVATVLLKPGVDLLAMLLEWVATLQTKDTGVRD